MELVAVIRNFGATPASNITVRFLDDLMNSSSQSVATQPLFAEDKAIPLLPPGTRLTQVIDTNADMVIEARGTSSWRYELSYEDAISGEVYDPELHTLSIKHLKQSTITKGFGPGRLVF